MRRSNRYRPELGDQLEGRLVLSSVSFRSPSVVVRGLNPRARVPGRSLSQPVVTLVNKSFDAFIADYTQARAAYLSTIQQTTDSTTLTTSQVAFKNYTRYRVDLLGQELNSSFVQGISTQARRSKSRQDINLAGLVQRKVNGLEVSSTTNGVVTLTANVYRTGTLGRALLDTIPAPGSPTSAASLSALAQDQAIEASRVAVLNGFDLAKFSASRSKS